MNRVKIHSKKAVWTVYFNKTLYSPKGFYFEWFCCPNKNDNCLLYKHEELAVPMSIKRKAFGAFRRLGLIK